MNDDLKLEVLKCFRKEVEEVRNDLKEIAKQHAVLAITNENNVSENKDMRSEMILQGKANTEQYVRIDIIEKRLVQHKQDSENNYKDLQRQLSLIADSFTSFKTSVLERLDKNKGRDTVLLFLATSGLGSLVIKIWFMGG